MKSLYAKNYERGFLGCFLHDGHTKILGAALIRNVH